MLDPRRISIVDLSDMDAPYLRNLVIAQMLRLLQEQQDEHYRLFEAAQRNGTPPRPPTRANIFIEEAHEFVSAERIKQMPNLFDQVARIARRGRKRYLGLVFVTQLPSHLPDEVFGLINNWIPHKLTDTNVIQRLRKVVPMVTDTAWVASQFGTGTGVVFIHAPYPPGHGRDRPIAVQTAHGRLGRTAVRPPRRLIFTLIVTTAATVTLRIAAGLMWILSLKVGWRAISSWCWR